MPARAMLVVMIVQDAMLRTMLTEALARAGVTLFAAPGVPNAPRRRLADSGVLLLDEASVAGEAGRWIEALWLERRWKRVIVLTLDMPVSTGDRGVLAKDGCSLSETLTELFED